MAVAEWVLTETTERPTEKPDMDTETLPPPIAPLPGQLPLFRTERTLFGPMEVAKEPEGRPLKRRCTPAPSGTGPEGETCKTCQSYTLVEHQDYWYPKCRKMEHEWTHGAATDIRAGWDACSEYAATIIKDAMFSPCRTWRYTLGRIWKQDAPLLAVIGLNPSTADEREDDPTIRRCMRFAMDWGYGGLMMLNLFAFRSTDPEGLKSASDPVGPGNDEAIRRTVEIASETLVAWGRHGSLFGRDEAVERLLSECETGGEVSCLEMNQNGSPKHPLYVKADIKRKYYPLPTGQTGGAT
jgi:hypothetical protein